MSSDREYLDFILDQLSECEDISFRAMFGEYVIYYRSKVIGGIYDNRFLVKNTKSVRALMPEADLEIPYEGAKEMIMVDDPENRALMKELFNALYADLPPARKKKS